jgi:hypothetical protein
LTVVTCFDERVQSGDGATWLFERAIDRVRVVDSIVAE